MSTTFEIPTLRTERLTLRAFRAGDLDALAAMQANPEVRRFLGDGAILDRAQAWSLMERMLGQWALRGYGMFAVEHDGSFAGWAGVLHPLEWPEPELGYSLDRPFWGQRHRHRSRSRRARLGIRHARRRSAGELHQARQRRSIRVAKKLGASREGMVELRGSQAEWWVHRR